MKVVINSEVGCFMLSDRAIELFFQKKGWTLISELVGDWVNRFDYWRDVKDYDHRWTDGMIERNDPELVAVVEELGDLANGFYAQLKIVEIPDDVQFVISNVDCGAESIHEVHRVWF